MDLYDYEALLAKLYVVKLFLPPVHRSELNRTIDIIENEYIELYNLKYHKQ